MALPDPNDAYWEPGKLPPWLLEQETVGDEPLPPVVQGAGSPPEKEKAKGKTKEPPKAADEDLPYVPPLASTFPSFMPPMERRHRITAGGPAGEETAASGLAAGAHDPAWYAPPGAQHPAADPWTFDPMASTDPRGDAAPDDAQLQSPPTHEAQLPPPDAQLPPPDASSGGALPQPENPDIRGPVDPYAMQPSGLTRDQQDRAVYYSQHPDRMATDQFLENQARQSKQVELQATLAKRDAEQAVADHQAYLGHIAQTQRDTAAVQADAARIANTPIHAKEMGIGNAFGILLGGIAGGYFKNGRNMGLEAFDKSVEDGVELQKANLANQWKGIGERKGAIADDYARNMDIDREATAYRVGQYQRGIQQIDTQMQQYDQRGSTVRGFLAVRQQLADRANQALMDREKRQMGNLKAITEAGSQLATARKAGLANPELEGMLGYEHAGGSGAGVASVGHENQLVAGLPPKDRERAVLSPDGKSFRLALDHETAVKQRDEIGSGNAAIGAADSVIADLSNDTDLMTKLKAKAGLNPKELAVLKSKLSLLKPMIAKVAAGTGRIPLAELHAVEAATDNPSDFTSETLAQIQAMRDATVNDLADKFQPEYPGFITKGSFGHAPAIKDAPNVNTISGPLMEAPVKGDKGYARFDLGTFDGSLKQLFNEYKQNPGLGGSKELNDQYDDIAKKQQAAADKISADIATLNKKAKRTPEENARLHNDTMALADRRQAIMAIDTAKKANVEYSRDKAAHDDLNRKLDDDSASVGY